MDGGQDREEKLLLLSLLLSSSETFLAAGLAPCQSTAVPACSWRQGAPIQFQDPLPSVLCPAAVSAFHTAVSGCLSDPCPCLDSGYSTPCVIHPCSQDLCFELAGGFLFPG